MSEQLDTIVRQRRTDTSVAKATNSALYEQLLSETAQLAHGTPEMVQVVLHQVCVEHNSKPAEVLMLVHDYLEMFAQFQQHEQAPEPDSPYMMREEG